MPSSSRCDLGRVAGVYMESRLRGLPPQITATSIALSAPSPVAWDPDLDLRVNTLIKSGDVIATARVRTWEPLRDYTA